jgi:hypothetical protein
MSNNIQNDIQTVNQTFDDMLVKFKPNYVNFHTNATFSLPSSPPPSSSDSSTATTAPTPAAAVTSAAAATPDPNDAELLKYRYAANQLLEKVRSQIASNSKKIAGINTDISPIQKAYLNIMETGTSLDQTKSAAVVSLEDYNELYRTTVFGTMMYAVGAGLILYLLYKPRIQTEI